MALTTPLPTEVRLGRLQSVTRNNIMENRTHFAEGRLKTMTTWQKYANQTGPATTTWNYDLMRGWLTNKCYQGASGPTYSHTTAGRLRAVSWVRGTTIIYAMLWLPRLEWPAGN